MKSKKLRVCLPVLFCALGASQRVDAFTNEIRSTYTSLRIPFTVTQVETAEAKEENAIQAQAAALIKAREFDKLDDLANDYRNLGESFANGSWKVGWLYFGLSPDDENTDAEWKDRLAALREWVAARPSSITARVGLASTLVDYAWKARGGGSASTVTDEGWRLLAQRLNEAQDVLTQAKTLTNKCPAYWSIQMTTAMGLGYDKATFQKIFDQAKAAYPNYSAYECRRAIYLLPRWYGTEGEWERELGKSADKLGGDAGDMLYARVVWSMQRYGTMREIFKLSQVSWPRVDRGFAVIEKKYPDSLAAKNERAKLAGMAGDKAHAQQYFADTKGAIDLAMWDAPGNYLSWAIWAYQR